MATAEDTEPVPRRFKRKSRRRALAKLPLLAAGAVVLPFRRRRNVTGISDSAAARKDEMLGLTAGLTRTIGGARVRSMFRSKMRRAEIRNAALEKATADAVEQLGNMKGLAMKLGQMMSYFNVVSEGTEDQLSELQSTVPPMEPDLVRAVIEDQLGDVPEKVFERWEDEPIAAASIGQVHRARLHDGRWVAVKVQYPGVREAFHADLDNMEAMTEYAALRTRADVTDYFNMIADALTGELDYALEQRNQQRLADMYRGHPYVLVPHTVPELCRQRVLVSEFVEGDRFKTAVTTRTEEERNHIGEVMYRFAFGCTMNGFFSGDPHPGNYLFPQDGRVGFLDFGMVVEFVDTDHASQIRRTIAGALAGEQDLIDEGLRHVGFLPHDGPSGEEVWAELQGVLIGPITEDRPVRLDRSAFRRDMQKLMDPRANTNRAVLKTDAFEGWAAIWMRYAVGALAAISKFAPEANWRHIVQEIVLGEPPRTEIGANWGDAPGGAKFIGSRFEQ